MNYNEGIFWDFVGKINTNTRLGSLEEKFKDIGNQIEELKENKSEIPKKSNFCEHSSDDCDDVKKVKDECKILGFTYGRFWNVPSDYYQRTLVERKRLLEAPSIKHLCKTLIFENVSQNVECNDKYNSKYYAVISQYVTKINSDKISAYFARHNEKLGKSKFNFRLTKDSTKLTGYKHNATAPFLLKMPIIISQKILKLKPKIFYVGGGHIDEKIELDCAEYVKKMNPIIFDFADELDEETIVKMGREEKIDVSEVIEPEKKVISPKIVEKIQKQEKKQEKKEQKKAPKKKKKKGNQAPQNNPNIFDIRIGRIETIKKHPKADKLFIEEIDVGEENPRQICSGLVGKIDEKDLLKKKVVVMCNLRKAKLVGVESHGMIMCAVTETGDVSLPIVPNDIKIGEKIFYEDVEKIEPANRVNKKAMKRMIPKFRSDENCFVCYENHFMTSSLGRIKSQKPNCIVK